MTTERSYARIDAAILDLLTGSWMPWAVVTQAIWEAFGEPAIGHRIHVLERRGLIASRIWGQGDERQLWLRRTATNGPDANENGPSRDDMAESVSSTIAEDSVLSAFDSVALAQDGEKEDR